MKPRPRTRIRPRDKRKNTFPSRSLGRFPCGTKSIGIMTDYLRARERKQKRERATRRRVVIAVRPRRGAKPSHLKRLRMERTDPRHLGGVKSLAFSPRL